jgi:hypothetical protein
MVDTFTSLDRILLPEVGAKENVWAPPVSAGLNDGVADLLDEVLSARVNVDVTAGNVTLSKLNGLTDTHRPMFINASGSPGVARTIFVPDPPTSKLYIVSNSTAVPVTFSTISGVGVVIGILSGGEQRVVYVDPVADDCFLVDFTEDLVLLNGTMSSYLVDIEDATAGDTQITIQAISQGKWALVEIPAFTSTITPGAPFNRFRLLPNTPATFDGNGIGAVSPTPPALEHVYALVTLVPTPTRWVIQSPREGVSDFFDVMVTDSVVIADGTVIGFPQNVIMTYYTG